MRLVIKYGSHHQFEAIVPVESLGIVAGKLVRGFTRTPVGASSYRQTGFIYGTVLDNAEVVAYI